MYEVLRKEEIANFSDKVINRRMALLIVNVIGICHRYENLYK